MYLVLYINFPLV